MKQFLKRALSLVLALTLVFCCIPLANAAEPYERIYGSNRYSTAFAVADRLKTALGVEKFANIVVACGTDYADALSGSYLANKKSAPILLVNKNNPKNLDDVVSYISNNLASGGMVYILGGTGAVPGELEAKLGNIRNKRLAGSGRYDTNLQILKEAGVGAGETILICTGNDYADALSASATGLPILLVNKNLNKLREDQKAFLEEMRGNPIYIIGGTGAVSVEIEQEVRAYGSSIRLAGDGRYETSVQIAMEFFRNPSTMVLAYGHNFPDGLCGGVLAYSMNAPIILTRDKTSRYAAIYAADYGISSATVLGGEGLISNDTCEIVVGSAEHKHNYSFDIVPASCETDGHFTYTCTCGQTYREEYAAWGHYWSDWSVTVEPTFEADGQEQRKCQREDCGKTETRRIEKLHAGKEAVYAFSSGDYITSSSVSFTAGTLNYEIGENIYVPGHLEVVSKAMVAAMEKVSGLGFDGGGKQKYLAHVHSSRDMLYGGQDWYQGLDTSETGSAFAGGSNAHVSPGDLYLGISNVITHELSHVLMFRQSNWVHSQLLNEGFAEYTTYLALLELEKTDPEAAYYIDRPELNIWNMHIADYGKLYEQPLEYWFDHTFEYSGNANYSIGFRFMWYLDEIYGDYSKWVTEMEAMYPFSVYGTNLLDSTVDMQLDVLKKTYGEDVLDNFYPWLKQNEALFDSDWDTAYWDLSGADAINWYPNFNAGESVVRLQLIQYQDLYVNLETARTYLKDYKGMDISQLTLVNPDKVTINLYKADGSYTTVSGQSQISLDGISYIKLVGSGKISELSVVGFQ